MTDTIEMEVVTDDDIGGFLKLFRAGFEAWVKAGEKLVEMVDRDPKIIDEIRERCPEIPRALLRKFEDIGRRKLDPRLLIAEDGGAMAKLRRLPESQQRRYLDGEKVRLVVETNHGTDILLVNVKDLTPAQATQALDDNGNVPDEKQKVWLAAEREKRLTKPWTERPWRKVGKKVEIPTGLYTRKQLLEMLKDCE